MKSIIFLFQSLLIIKISNSATNQVEDSCDDSCNHHGTCSKENPLHSYCICDLWFTGQQCELEVPGHTIFIIKICAAVVFSILILVSFAPLFIEECRFNIFKRSEFRLLGTFQFSQFLYNRRKMRRADYQELQDYISVHEVLTDSRESGSNTEAKASSTTISRF